MKKFMRYLHGGVIGMCGEYLYRVEYSQWCVLVLIATIGLVVIYLLSNDK